MSHCDLHWWLAKQKKKDNVRVFLKQILFVMPSFLLKETRSYQLLPWTSASLWMQEAWLWLLHLPTLLLPFTLYS